LGDGITGTVGPCGAETQPASSAIAAQAITWISFTDCSPYCIALGVIVLPDCGVGVTWRHELLQSVT